MAQGQLHMSRKYEDLISLVFEGVNQDENVLTRVPIWLYTVYTDRLRWLNRIRVRQVIGFDPFRAWKHSVAATNHEIFSTVILSLPLIQEGQLSVSGERMCTVLVNRLED